MNKKTIGVLALQGAVTPHKAHIEGCGAEFAAVKTEAQIKAADALILPGGESTTMLKLIDRFGLENALKEAFESKPIWGICAGAILLAEKVTNPEQKSFGVLPIEVKRNGYGRQLDSSHEKVGYYTVSFIRAPIITKTSQNIDIIEKKYGSPIWIEHQKVMVTTFHPELTNITPSPMHKRFVDMVL